MFFVLLGVPDTILVPFLYRTRVPLYADVNITELLIDTDPAGAIPMKSV